MRIKILLILGILLTLTIPTLASAAPPREDPQRQAPPATDLAVCTTFLATNTTGQTRVITSNDPRFYTNTAYATLECGATDISVPRGKRGLVVVTVDAEVTCTGTDPAVASQWCLGRVLIGGAEGQPSASEPDSFAWAQSSPDGAAWESAAFQRTHLLACPATHPTPLCGYAIVVQVRNHAAGLSFRVDDSTVHAETRYL